MVFLDCILPKLTTCTRARYWSKERSSWREGENGVQDFLETRKFYRGKKARHICPGPCASRKSITPVLRALQTVFEKSKQKPTVLQSSRSSSILHVKTYLL